MLSNLYYRRVEEFVSEGTDNSREIMLEHKNSLSNDKVEEDCRHLLEETLKYETASKEPMGCLGYCMNGPFAFSDASRINQHIRATASIHDVEQVTDSEQSPHLNSHKIKGEIYFGCAETDKWVPNEKIESLEKHLSKTNINYQIEWYPRTQHGFVFPERNGKCHRGSAERHWHRILSLLEKNHKKIVKI